MTVVGSTPEEVPVTELPESLCGHDHEDPTDIRWGTCLGRAGYYDSAVVDGITYKVIALVLLLQVYSRYTSKEI
jgi:hypothetical protein